MSMNKKILIDSKDDGVTHINIYSKGLTCLGRLLSNFAYAPINIPEDGIFDSIEGYWYWLGCGDKRLRSSSGFKAKELGRQLRAPDWNNTEEFKQKILEAIRIKFNSHGVIKDLMRENPLPFTHYYVYKNKVILVPEGYWIIQKWETLRSSL